MAGRESTSSRHGGKSYGHSESGMLLGVSETASGIIIQAAFTASFEAFSDVILSPHLFGAISYLGSKGVP